MDKERALAEGSFSSSLRFELVSNLIDFPKDFKDKAILEVGAGASNATYELQKRGVIAIAFDYRYANMKNLISSVNKTLTKNIQYDRRLELYGLSKEEFESSNKDYARHSRISRDKFLLNYRNGQSQLVAGLAGFMPFKENTFDLCYSIQCLIPFLIDDVSAFDNVIQESLRVIKPGGELQLHPWPVSDVNYSEQVRLNANNLLRQLTSKEINYSVEEVGSLLQPRLRITKPR